MTDTTWQTATAHKRAALLLYPCGGAGRQFTSLLLRSIGDLPSVSARYVETRTPSNLAASEVITLRPDQLPRVPAGLDAEWLATTGLDLRSYQHLVGLVSGEGLSQLPALGWFAAGRELPTFIASIERDARAVITRTNGISRVVLLTASSAMGGTGAPSARLVGCAARIASRGADFPGGVQWLHAVVTSSLQPESARTRRTRALEHQQLQELRALMAPGTSLRLPGVREPVAPPGPDHLILLGSSAETPRTLDEVANELGASLRNLLLH
jgi:hypothetical protein